MKRAFTSLTPQEALHIAILIEERNAELYHRFAEMFVEFRDTESLEVASVFWEMAVEEHHHSSLLQSKYLELYGNSRCGLTEEDLAELIEVPRLNHSDIFVTGNDACGLDVRERALRVALNAEQSAHAYYKALLQNTPKGPLRQLYLELSQMEDNHAACLERKLVPRPGIDKTVN